MPNISLSWNKLGTCHTFSAGLTNSNKWYISPFDLTDRCIFIVVVVLLLNLCVPFYWWYVAGYLTRKRCAPRAQQNKTKKKSNEIRHSQQNVAYVLQLEWICDYVHRYECVAAFVAAANTAMADLIDYVSFNKHKHMLVLQKCWMNDSRSLPFIKSFAKEFLFDRKG